jgi:hypothetical protein
MFAFELPSVEDLSLVFELLEDLRGECDLLWFSGMLASILAGYF